MNAVEACPECGSEDFDELTPDSATSQRLQDVIVLVCRDCGTAWEADAPRR